MMKMLLTLLDRGERENKPIAKHRLSPNEGKLLLDSGWAELRKDGTGESRPRERWYLTSKGKAELRLLEG